MNFRRVAATMILSCSLASVVAPLAVGVNGDNKETAEAAQEEETEQLNIDLLVLSVERNNIPEVSTSEAEEPEIEWQVGYVTASSLNVRKEPNKDSKVVKTLGFNDKVKYYKYNKKWACTKNGNYISLDYLSDKKTEYKTFNVPYARNKTWMPYTAITNRSSKQYKLQQICYTGTYGIRQYDGRYCVALGSHFGCEIGQYFDLVLANGTVIPCVMADQKDNRHTDSSNIVTVKTNCLSEFVVDRAVLNSNAKRHGDISSCTSEWDSVVAQIRVYDKGVWDE